MAPIDVAALATAQAPPYPVTTSRQSPPACINQLPYPVSYLPCSAHPGEAEAAAAAGLSQSTVPSAVDAHVEVYFLSNCDDLECNSSCDVAFSSIPQAKESAAQMKDTMRIAHTTALAAPNAWHWAAPSSGQTAPAERF